MMLFAVIPAQGQEQEQQEQSTHIITIGGSVYGGGRRGAILETKDIEKKIETETGTETIQETLTGGEGAGSTSVVLYEGTVGNDETVEHGMGNIFGGGYGPAARVMKTKVQMFGGTVYNSLYGGGEIAAVGWGLMDPPIDKIPILRKVKRQGTASVEMYRGHVMRDVFGGGRGFTETDGDGDIAQERLYTDGYVFGSAKVCIYGGTIGTLENTQEDYGNVFGGGNVGFFYSGNEKKTVGVDADLKHNQFLDRGKSYYVIPRAKKNYNQASVEPEEWAKYKDDDFFADANDATLAREGELSIACEVLIEPWCRVKENVTINGQTYNAGSYITTDELDYLQYKTKTTEGNTEVVSKVNTAEWGKLETDGITIWNAVFAGGNVSTGDDKVYAETTTVYGNVAVTINDLYFRDLISIGTEIGSKHVGGLYGDGNLTFADGYRELSLSTYGTDFYNLKSEVDQGQFNELNDREKKYYQMKYKCVTAYPTENPQHEVGETITESIYTHLPESEKGYWNPAGFRSKYAGRLLNTIQRTDFAGVFGSRLVLQGAMDRVLTKEGDQLNFEDYTINRVGELSFNKYPEPGQPEGSDICYGNYFGIYNQVNYLGALTSDIRFYEDDWEDTEDPAEDTDVADLSALNKNYSELKEYIMGLSSTDPKYKFKNLGTSKHLIALASGVALELKQEPAKGSNKSDWGMITGVIQLDLLNVTQGEGGGFVYARNEHGTASRYKVDNQDYVRTFLSPYNNSGKAATHEEYVYDKTTQLSMQTSGNFVKSKKNEHGDVQYIVDDCYPTHGEISSSDATKAHYWYIRGTKYAYNLYISAFTGAAKMYQGSKGIQLSTGAQGKLQLIDVYHGYYCNIDKNAQPITVNDVEYRRGDPISWWDYHNYLEIPHDPNKGWFIADTEPAALSNFNNMNHENGFVLAFEFDDNNADLSYWNPTTYPTPYNNVEKGPSFSTTAAGVYGKYHYAAGDLISDTEADKFSSKDGLVQHPYSDYMLCVQSLQLNSGGSLLLTKGELVAKADIPALVKKYRSIKLEIPEDQVVDVDPDDPYPPSDYTEAVSAINGRLDDYWQVTAEGDFGGTNYTSGTKYDAIDGWGMLSETDRKGTDSQHPSTWSFNNDALDLLNDDAIARYRDEKDVTLTSSPQATVSLYMSRDSRLMTLNESKNLTVHFRYYNGEDPEDHYINITIEFKDELPDVGALDAPDIVLPGTRIAFKQPKVVASYSIAGGGWEYYTSKQDATTHVGGTKFENGQTPFYWYQDGYYVNYYAETMYGRTYSENTVQIKVANSHDLKDVIESPNHLMIDKAGARDAKIYINDYTNKSESGVDLLKELFNKSLDDNELDSRVKGLANLDIILRADLAPKIENSWTSSIGSGGSQCFEGNLHGDGYTISGLNASLFNKLCGNVYNLGVTGSFTSSGIADTSNGHIENCWVSTTGTPDNNTEPIADGGIIVNSYYNDNKYSKTNEGTIEKNDRFFYNGNVTYELNGFHLKHKNRLSEGTLTNLTPNYVENRYADGDFIYADGTIPKPYVKEDDPRWDSQNNKYKALDNDYIFFGQRLTYGYRQGMEHEDKPSRISDDMVNRVYRAPAYFQNAIAEKAYYNKDAVFAAKSADGLHDVYPGMTAIDFTGNGTTSTTLDHDGLTDFINADLTQNLLVYANYVNDDDDDTEDDDDLLTRLLDSKEPAYTDYKKTTKTSGSDSEIVGANSVGVVSDESISPIKGHVVFKKSNAYETNSDHFLVDRQDFFAPISYQMASGKRMWYQRQPDNYAEKVEKTENQETIYQSIGWESLSLPFTAELVTTQKKGEITHFYAGETKGHEYWLRGYLGTGTTGNNIFEANFQYPAAGSSAKTVTNTFLWDYYYSKENREDANSDQYQPGSTQNDYHYYQKSRSYTGYPRVAANTPYIVGFPGETYYEFDLSGQFEAKHAKERPAQFGAQTITFATAESASIPVTSNAAVAGTGEDKYDFVPCFVRKDAGTKVYMLNKHVTEEDDPAGTIFEQVNSDVQTVPFRAYFTANSGASPTRGVIFVNGDNSEMSTFLDPVERQESEAEEGLIIRPGERSIIVKSNLNEQTSVRIVNISGITLRTFTINPGETIVTPVHLAGIYIVNHKKVAVK